MLVIMLNCVTLGMFRPCEDVECRSERCGILEVGGAGGAGPGVGGARPGWGRRAELGVGGAWREGGRGRSPAARAV